MKIRHKVVLMGNSLAYYQKLLEHIRYSGSRLLSWEDNRTNLIAKCLYVGTKHGFEMCVKRAYSFIGITIEKT